MSDTINIGGFIDNMDRYITKNEKTIATDVFQESVTSNYCTTIINAKGEYQLSSARMGELIQPFQKTWTSKGTPEFVPQKIQVRRCKVDITLYPDEIYGEWQGFLADEKKEPKDYPLVKYVMEQLITPQIQEDRELKIIYNGVYKAPLIGTAGAAVDCFDGLGTVIDNHITDGLIAPIPLGSVTAGNAFEKLEEFHDNLPFKWQQRPLNVFMSHTLRKASYRDRRTDYGGNNNYNPNQQNDTIDFTNHKTVALPSMFGKQRIWSTPKRNMLRLFDQIDPSKRLKWTIEKEKRAVHIFTQWNESVGFAIPQLVFASDGDL